MSDRGRALAHLPPRAIESAASLAARTLAEREERALALAPRTLVVDPSDPTCHGTIGAAIEAARPGDRVLVRPGHYVESVLVDKAVAVEGDGDREAIVVEGPDLPAFVLSAARASICRVTVIGGPADIDALAPEEDYWRFAAVVVTADVLVTDIVIRNGWTDGISVSHSSSPTISDNDIRKRDGIGIAVFDSSSPAITGNDIRESNFGICAMDNSTPRVEGNTIRENDDEGVSVAGSAAPTIVGNDIRGNKWGGIWVSDAAAPAIANNDIEENGHHGLWVTDPSPLIAGNRVNRNLGPGISISGKTSAPTITGNSIQANGNSGIEVSQGAKPTIEGNEFSDNGGSGIWAWGDGTSPQIYDNLFHDSAQAWVTSERRAQPAIGANRVELDGEIVTFNFMDAQEDD